MSPPTTGSLRGAPAELAVRGFPGPLDTYVASPPDTGGAVGPNHVVTMLNSQVMIQSRSGDVRPDYPVPLEQFWSGLGPFDKVFDPRILYDPLAGRWIASAGVNPASSAAGLLLAVSETGDPAGAWSLIEIQTGKDGCWPDYPVLALNGNWIVLSANLFTLPPGAYSRTSLYVFDKSDLYRQHNSSYTVFNDYQGTLTPAVDAAADSATLYFVQAFSSVNGGRIRISALEGAAAGEVFIGGSSEIPIDQPWAGAAPYDADFAPQSGTWLKIDAGDSRLQNCVFRNAAIWCVHTVFLPAEAPTRSSLEWFAVDPAAGKLQQRGRIDDPAGTAFYAYPSIAVNRNDDVMVGYSHFTAGDYPSAGFSYRLAADPAGAVRPGIIAKAGEAPYVGPDADSGTNRWGDFSATMVDPVDDLTFWTVQEYAAFPTDHYPGRWATWWTQAALPAIRLRK